MKRAKEILKYYVCGIVLSLILIAFIHLYSLFFEPYYRYAEWSNCIETALISGIPFGISVCVFKIIFKQLKHY